MRRVLLALAAVGCVVPALVAGAGPVIVRAADPTPSWIQLDSHPQKRTGGTATVLDSGKVLIAGGDLLSTEIFDPATGSFSDGPPQHFVQAGATATKLVAGTNKGKVLLVGGRDLGALTPQVEIYDPAGAGSWTNQAQLVAQLARWDHTATLLPSPGADGSSLVLVAGGTSDGTTPLATAEIYDSGANTNPNPNPWKATLTSMSTARTLHAAAPLPDGRVLVTGGQTAPNPVTKQQYTASSEIYDPSVGHWQPAGPLSVARSQLTLTPIGASLLAVGGLCTPIIGLTTTCPDAVADAVDTFNTSTSTWSAATGLKDPRFGHTAVPFDAGVMVVGGQTSASSPSASNSVAFFDPATSSWHQLANLGTARAGAPLAVIPGPQTTCKPEVLVVGGTDRTGANLGSAELYRAQPWITAQAPTRGPAGGATTVTVTGGALDTVTSAQIGSRSVSFNAPSASFTAPPEKAADGAIQQVSVASATCTARGSLAFSYDPPAVSQVTRPFGPATVVPNAPSVQVSGSSFAGINLVLFGAHEAPILAINPDGTVTVQPPPHVASEPLTVAVSVRAGEVASQVSGSYTYVEPPVIGAVNPSSVSARDLTLAISGHGFQYLGQGATDGVTIGGLPAGQPAIAGDTDMVVTLPAGLKPGPQDVVVTTLGMTSNAFRLTVLPPPSEPVPPSNSGSDPGSGTQPAQQPLAPAGPGGGGGTSTAIETIPSSATLQSTASLGQGYVITPGHAPAPGLGQLPGLLQLPGYAPVGVPGSAMPGAAPATVAEGAPGMGQGNPVANVAGDEGPGGRARYGMVRAPDPGAWLAGGIMFVAIISLVLTWAPRLRRGQEWAPGYVDL